MLFIELIELLSGNHKPGLVGKQIRTDIGDVV